MTTDDTVTAKLAEWETLVEGATQGEWIAHALGGEVSIFAACDTPDCDADPGCQSTPLAHPNVVRMDGDEVLGQMTAADAEFIAAAPTIARALLGFVEEVRKIHFPNWYETEEVDLCNACIEEDWPCPTEQAAQKWIGGEG